MAPRIAFFLVTFACLLALVVVSVQVSNPVEELLGTSGGKSGNVKATESEIDAIAKLEGADDTLEIGNEQDKMDSELKRVRSAESVDQNALKDMQQKLKSAEKKIYQLVHSAQEAEGSLSENDVIASKEERRLEKQLIIPEVRDEPQHIEPHEPQQEIHVSEQQFRVNEIQKPRKHMLNDAAPAPAAPAAAPAPVAAAAPPHAAAAAAASTPAPHESSNIVKVIKGQDLGKPQEQEPDSPPVFLFHGFWLLVFVMCLAAGCYLAIWSIRKV